MAIKDQALDRSLGRATTPQWTSTKRSSRQAPQAPVPIVLRRILRPLVGGNRRQTSVDIYQYLRNSILANVLPPDTILSQVEVADCLNVSRTPVREALRMLQKEGLISAEPNFRCRVLGFDPEELELLYVSRVMNEGISAAITVEKMKDADVDKLHALFAQMCKAEKRQNFSEWIERHRAFHQMLFSGVNLKWQQRMYVDCQRSERYVYNAKQSGLTEIFRRTAVEHKAILRACKRWQSALVASLLIQHLAKAGIEIIGALAPRWEPTTLRTAVGFMLRGAAHADQCRNQCRNREGTRPSLRLRKA